MPITTEFKDGKWISWSEWRRLVNTPDPLDVAEESLAVTCPHCGHTSDVRIPARPVVSSPAAADKA